MVLPARQSLSGMVAASGIVLLERAGLIFVSRMNTFQLVGGAVLFLWPLRPTFIVAGLWLNGVTAVTPELSHTRGSERWCAHTQQQRRRRRHASRSFSDDME